MENSSKPTTRKKVISTFILCSATFFALSCFTLLARFGQVGPISFWFITPNLVVGFLFGVAMTGLLFIGERFKRTGNQFDRIFINCVIGVVAIVVAIALTVLDTRLPHSTWRLIVAGPEPAIGFVKVDNTHLSPAGSWLVHGKSGVIYQLDCLGKDCRWVKFTEPISTVPVAGAYAWPCAPNRYILWPFIYGHIVDWSIFTSCGPEATGTFVAILLDDGTLWRWHEWSGLEELLDVLCWPIAAILTLVVCSALTSRKAGANL